VQVCESPPYAAARLTGLHGWCQDGMRVLQEIDRVQAKQVLLALHEMQSSGDATTGDLSTGALSNLAQHEGWRARMQMLDMLSSFSMGQ
jgi:hypothetical protein